IAKGLTCGLFPLSCVMFAPHLATFLRELGIRPLTFTHGLSEPAAYFALACLHKYDEVFASKEYSRRCSLVAELFRRYHDILPPGSVECTNTTLRFNLPAYTTSAALRSLDGAGLWAYSAFTELPDLDSDSQRGFIHICPPFDLAVAHVES